MAGLFSALRAEVALPAEQNREELREGEWRVSKRQKGGSEYVSRFPMQASHPILQSTVAYLFISIFCNGISSQQSTTAYI
jgi:hypothetical protein